MIELLQANTPADIPALLDSGLPAQAQMAHRPGGNFDTRGDAALVHSPGGDYILVVFLNTAAQNFDWTAANAIMADLSKATYNYFNCRSLVAGSWSLVMRSATGKVLILQQPTTINQRLAPVSSPPA